MSKSAEWIHAEFDSRRRARGPQLQRMDELRRAYNGEVIIPLPEMEENERVAVANLIAQGLDQKAMRISSTMPDVFFPPDKVNVEREEKNARKRRQATLAWWHQNRMKLKLRKRARWLIGYAVSPVIIRPDFKRNIPTWELRDPLATFPPTALGDDELTPPDCIFSFKRSLGWLKERYPIPSGMLQKGPDPKSSDVYELVEYIDAEERVLIVVGKQKDYVGGPKLSEAVELDRVPNRCGQCWAVVPGRISLDRDQGEFDGAIGIYQSQARLMALAMIATERGIFPDTYLVSRPGEQADFIAGPFDGRSGKVNIIKGGDIREQQTQPGFQTNPMINYLERAMRLTGGIPAEFGGESTTNVRTGRRGDAILSAVVDFPIQEAQDIFAESLAEENKRAIAIEKAYFPAAKSFYVSWAGAKGRIDYTPSQIFTSDHNYVTYSHAGADINNLIIGIGQRVGIGLMSKRTGQELDPLIEDPELEHDRTITEAMEQALLVSVQQRASAGEIAPEDVARLMQIIRSDKKDLAEAIMQIQKEAEERQAREAQAQQMAPGSPEAMPGLNPAQMQEQMGPIQGPPPAQRNLAMILNEMRLGRQEAQQTGAVAPAPAA